MASLSTSTIAGNVEKNGPTQNAIFGDYGSIPGAFVGGSNSQARGEESESALRSVLVRLEGPVSKS